QRLFHPPVHGQHPDAADAPAQSLALVHEAVVVHRLVRTVETAHADVDDTRRDEVTIVGRRRQPVAPVRQRPRAERLRWDRIGHVMPPGAGVDDLPRPRYRSSRTLAVAVVRAAAAFAWYRGRSATLAFRLLPRTTAARPRRGCRGGTRPRRPPGALRGPGRTGEDRTWSARCVTTRQGTPRRTHLRRRSCPRPALLGRRRSPHVPAGEPGLGGDRR